jgi:hypothetical protein
MEPVISLKRLLSVDTHLCIFCQRTKRQDGVREAGEEGLVTVREATATRKKLRDVKNRDTVDRLDSVLTSKEEVSLVWHRNCYSQYTDKGKIQRLQAAEEQKSRCEPSAAEGQSSSHTQQSSALRSSTNPVDWSMCMFCQVHSTKRLNLIMTKNTSDQILENAKFDYTVGIRVADVKYLIASDAKYHLSCLASFTRAAGKARTDSKATGLPMIWLCNELQYAAEKGQVIRLSDVWERYVLLAEESGSEIPRSFVSRLALFKKKLQS